MYRHCEILFSESLPLFSSLGTFELGIEAPDTSHNKEIDIDSAIKKAENSNNNNDSSSSNRNLPERPKSIAIPTSNDSPTRDVKTFLVTPTSTEKSVTNVNL